ncbi:hypothetical protein [Lacticaseibacillus rhamnosus]|nr:hypothetical protein [Lacticaseibacillus rhamnosus]
MNKKLTFTVTVLERAVLQLNYLKKKNPDVSYAMLRLPAGGVCYEQ